MNDVCMQCHREPKKYLLAREIHGKITGWLCEDCYFRWLANKKEQDRDRRYKQELEERREDY